MSRLSLCLQLILLATLLSGCANLTRQPSASAGSPSPPNPISVVITNKFTNQVAGGPAVVVNATVSNDSADAGVTWTLTAGGNCALACGSLSPSSSSSFSAVYTPPPGVPSAPNATPTITATSVTDKTKSDSFTFSLAAPLVPLPGGYAILLRGFDSNGVPAAIAGTLVLDQKGGVSGGQLDINIGGQITSIPSPLGGSYLVDTSFNGITRATINITGFTFPGSNSNLGLKCAFSADGKRGKAIEFDNSGVKTAGVVLLQDSAALTGAVPAGNFAFGLDSDSSTGVRIVEAGQFSLGAAGVTGGLVDLSKAGNAAPIDSAAPIAPSAATLPDSLGRGTITLSAGGNSTQYAYYIVDAARLNLIEIDNGQALGTVQAGVARLQKPLTASSINTTSVVQMTGIDKTFATQNLGPAVIIGVLSVAAANSVNLTFDGNDAGTVLTTRPVAGQIVSFDPATGRGILSVTQGAINGFLNSAVFYLFDSGNGFLIDADPTTPSGTPHGQQVTNKAYSGIFSPQVAGPFGNKSLSGNLISITGASAIPSIPDIVLGVSVDSSGSFFTAIADVASLNSQIGNSANRIFSSDYQVEDSILGHGRMTLPPGFFDQFSLNQSAPATFYLVGQNQLVLIGVLSGADSGVSSFDPE